MDVGRRQGLGEHRTRLVGQEAGTVDVEDIGEPQEVAMLRPVPISTTASRSRSRMKLSARIKRVEVLRVAMFPNA